MARSGSGGMPELVAPMHAAPGELPTGPGWAVEFAWDGLRAIAYARPGRVRLLTARDRSVTAAFPELHALAGMAPAGGMVLDGTVVALDDAGIPSKRLLMRRTATHRPAPPLLADVPVGYFVSDLMFLDGEHTTALPYRRRRELIEGLGLAEQPVVVSPSWPVTDAAHVLQTAGRYGLDGIYARRLDAPYQAGRRSRNWLRVSLRRTRQVVVGGWTPADPARPDTVAALLLGVPGPEGLRYVGRVGPGTGAERHTLTTEVPALRAPGCPFTGELPAAVVVDAQWAQPRLVGRVDFAEWTAGGRLRLPVWRGLVGPDEIDDSLWDDREAVAAAGEEPDLGPSPAADAPDAGPDAPPDTAAALEAARLATAPPPEPTATTDQVQERRLEQHFVYNSLNTIASLVRTDPGRARTLLLGFADLARAADRPAGERVSLRDELDAVRAYLGLEQARFGRRLHAEVHADPGLDDVEVAALALVVPVREVVQRSIEPRPEGGAVTVRAERRDGECVVTVTDEAAGESRVLTLGAVGV